jgi:hypothetical protein
LAALFSIRSSSIVIQNRCNFILNQSIPHN